MEAPLFLSFCRRAGISGQGEIYLQSDLIKGPNPIENLICAVTQTFSGALEIMSTVICWNKAPILVPE